MKNIFAALLRRLNDLCTLWEALRRHREHVAPRLRPRRGGDAQMARRAELPGTRETPPEFQFSTRRFAGEMSFPVTRGGPERVEIYWTGWIVRRCAAEPDATAGKIVQPAGDASSCVAGSTLPIDGGFAIHESAALNDGESQRKTS